MTEFPSEIKGYSPICLCGKGAYGYVWLTVDAVGNYRALKIVSKSMLGGDWEREFKGLRNYHTKVGTHTNLIQIYHIEDCGNFFYYTMEAADNLGDEQNYIPSTLENWVIHWGALEKDTIEPLFDQLLDGIEALHQLGLIHRDIKPDNIVFIENVPKLSDIGLISSASQTLSLAGTQAYVPPEILTGQTKKVTPAIDYYALGKTLYRAFSGQQPDDFPVVPHKILQTPSGKVFNRLVKCACHPNTKLRVDNHAMFQQLLHGQTGFSYKIKFLLHLAGKFIGNIYFSILLILVMISIIIFAIWGPIVNSFTPKTTQEHTTWTNNDENEFISLRQKPDRTHSEEIRLMELMEKVNNIALMNNKSMYEVTEAGKIYRQYVEDYKECFDYVQWRFISEQKPFHRNGYEFTPNQYIDMILTQMLPGEFQIKIDLNIPENNQEFIISVLSEDSVVYSRRSELNKKIEQLPHCVFSFRINSKGTYDELSYINDAVISSSTNPYFTKLQPLIPQTYIGKNQIQIVKTGYQIQIYANDKELFSCFDFPWRKNYLRLQGIIRKNSDSIYLNALTVYDIRPTDKKGRGTLFPPLPKSSWVITKPQEGQKLR